MINPLLTLDRDNGNERAKLPVIGSSFTGPQSGNYVVTQGVDFKGVGREFFLQNDDNFNLTFTVVCDGGVLGFQIQPGEQFDERLPIFSSVIVLATGNWRWRVRGNAS